MRAVFHLGLEADQVVEGAELVVLAQLDHRMGPPAGPGIGEADRLHRAEAQRFRASDCHHLDRHTALEIGSGLLPLVEIHFFRRQQAHDKGVVLTFIHRAIYVIGAIAFIVAALEPGDVEIDALFGHDRRDRVEERQLLLAGQAENRLRKGRRGQRPGGDDHLAPFLGGKSGDLAALERDFGVIFQRPGDTC